jgi:hypothetical protein
MKTFFIISLIPSIVILVGFSMGIYKKTYQHKVMQWVFAYLCFSGILDIIQKYLWVTRTNNLFLFHIYTPLELIFLTLFYAQILKKDIRKEVFLVITLAFVSFSVFASLYIQSIENFNTYTRFVEAIVILFYSIVYLIKTIPKIETLQEFQESNHYFAVVTGICLYFLGSFLILSLSNSVLKFGDAEFRHLIWILHIIFLVVLYSAIGIGIWITPKKRGFIQHSL